MAFNVLANYATEPGPSDAALAQIDAGSQLDLVIANSSDSNGSVRLGNSDGTFGSSQSTGTKARSVATGDLDGDGIADLASISGSNVSLQKGNGDGTFQAPQNILLPSQVAPGNPDPTPLTQRALSVVAGDLNADGNLDLVVGGLTEWSEYYRTYGCGYYSCGYTGWWITNTDGYVNVLMDNGNGTFAEPAVHPLGRSGAPGAIAMGDLNSDGNADLITANQSNLSALLGDGAGGLGAPTISGTGGAATTLALCDVDGDGRLDAVTESGDYVNVNKGQGNGSFAYLARINVRHRVDSVVAGDVNGDGNLDLAAVGTAFTCNDQGYYGCYDGDYRGQVSVLLGRGTGSFSLPVVSSLGTDFDGTFVDSALADLTGDGRTDLVTIESSTGRAFVAANDGNWTEPVAMSISPATVSEGNVGTTLATFTVTLASPSPSDVSVDYATADLNVNEQYWNGVATATAGLDYTATAGTLTIPARQTSGTIDVLIIGDRSGESDESFFVKLRNPVYAIVDNPQALGTITDDEPYVSLQYVSDPATVEGNSGTTPKTFNVILSAASDVPVTVDFATANGTAMTGSDYESAAGTVTFEPGQATQTVTVQVIGDTQAEDDEFFSVLLSNATNAKMGTSYNLGYIADDDRIATISISDASVYEGKRGSRSMTFTVSLSEPSTQTVRVNYSTDDGTAKTSNNDYVAKSGTLTFSPGQTSKTITIKVKGDKKVESDEYFYVNLSGARGAPIADGQGEGGIWNDDEAASRSGRGWHAAAFDAALDELLSHSRKKRGWQF